MKFRKFLCCVICLCICVAQLDAPIRTALAEDGQYIYEDGYAIRINPDGTRTITVTTSLDDAATPVVRMMRSAPLMAAAPTPANGQEDDVQVNIGDSSVSIETEDFGIFFSPSVSENPVSVTEAEETPDADADDTKSKKCN